MRERTQGDIVKNKMAKEPTETFDLRIPGVKDLHLRSIEEIAEVLAIALKSQSNLLELRYKVGESIEVTVRNL